MILVLALTAAELSELEEARLAGLGRQPATRRSAVALQARSSLVARGLLDNGGRLRVDDSDESMLLTTVLDARLATTRSLAVERVVASRPHVEEGTHLPSALHPAPDVHPGSRDFVRGVRLVHLLDDEEGAVVEDVLADDVRHLWLAPDRSQVLEAVTSVTVPAAAVPGCGAPRSVGAAEPQALASALDHPTVLVELTVVESGEPATGELVALGPRGCWSATIDRSAPPPAVLEFQPVPPSHVAAWVGASAGQGTMSR